MLTLDENIVEIKFAVQYRLNDARAFLFESRDPDLSVVKAPKRRCAKWWEPCAWTPPWPKSATRSPRACAR